MCSSTCCEDLFDCRHFATSCFSFPLPCDGVHRRFPVSNMSSKNGSSPALASALLSYIVAAKSQHADCENLSFQFGPYGGKVQYSFQPRLDGIAHNFEGQEPGMPWIRRAR